MYSQLSQGYLELNSKQQAILALWQQVNASLTAYNKLLKTFFCAEEAWQASVADWQKLGLHAKHIQRHKDTNQTTQFLEAVNLAIQQGRYQLLFKDSSAFPVTLHQLFDTPPLLFAKGNISRLQQAQIAIVGSRKPTPHAQKITFDMAQYLAQAGYIVSSGLAQGVDYQAHIGALTQADDIMKGRTVGVMGTGIEVCYPRHHNTLFAQIIDEGGCLISELLPYTPANKHTFPRRNRIVAGLSLGTIVTEATIQSGSLITARLTSEQGKQVFAVPSHIDNLNAEGCHHLIREGATLVYHPQQVIDDLRYQQIQPIITPLNQPPQTIKPSDAPESRYQKYQHEPTNSKQDKAATEVLTETPVTSQKHAIQKNASQANHILNVDTSSTPSISSMPSISSKTLPLSNTQLTEPLNRLFDQIDWNGVDVDCLVERLNIPTHILLGQLMELELQGLIMMQGGRYVRI